jgi:hypothetical protein
MNPPQWNCWGLLRWPTSYISVLWKNSVAAAFYAVFFAGACQKGTKTAVLAAMVLSEPPTQAGFSKRFGRPRVSRSRRPRCHNVPGEFPRGLLNLRNS